ncbi:hypothetical protein BOW52_02985 [Solemya elarraichensis gill symbiont]|uniref:Sensory/regulatory protein RpfC n=2 Tax=Solemya elarraichensis gill symbiont TaxID=1918949 RepID=A0A1T2LBM8_9GAMM|nr:hypothetical protein BOW52_02985 [Solemya elarraichensis gill symbiont]
MAAFGSVIVILISAGYNMLSQKAIIANEVHKLQKISDEKSLHTDLHLGELASVTTTISSAPLIKSALQRRNKELAALSDEERIAVIDRRNQWWREITDINDPFIQAHMTNPVAEFLKTQQKLFPGRYGEIFLTNLYGEMIATTGKLTTLAHSRKYWWQAAYDDGRGRIFLDDRGFDASVEGYVLGVVVPIKDQNRIIGILKANVNIIGALSDVVEKYPIHHSGMVQIVRTGGLVVSEHGVIPLSKHVDKTLVRSLQKKVNGTSIVFENNKNVLKAFSSVSITMGSEKFAFGGSKESVDHIKGNKGEGWHVVISLDEITALAANRDTTLIIIIVGMTFVLISSAVSLLLGKLLARPIVELAASAQNLGKGDLAARASAYSDDEIGSLAKSLNRTAESLQETMVSRDELKHAQEATRQAQCEAEKANEAKSIFLARMSREIRTPMNAVIGLSHLALQADLTFKQRDYLDKIMSSGQSLLQIINDILDFSKIEAGKLELLQEEFILKDVLKHISNVIAIKCAEENLELIFSVEPNVPLKLIGDKTRLEEVLLNLAGNAVKFTEHGEIVISVCCLEFDTEKAILEFSVRDSGMGISPEQMERLFKPFSQANEHISRDHGGTGLGLILSKRLVEMMGGVIRARSEIGHGTEFTFTVTFGLGDDLIRYPLDHTHPDLHRLKVLIIDDNEEARKVLKQILESFTCKVTVTDSGEHGVNAVEVSTESPYRLIIIDDSMPSGMDAIETITRIRKLPGYSEVPTLLMISPYNGEEHFEKVEEIGVSSLTFKPIESSALFDAVMEALNDKDVPAKAVKLESGSAPWQSEKINGARILLVEDNSINQQVAMELLEQMGCEVEMASNGIEAVDMIKHKKFDLVFMDIQMPKMDGLEATRQIRKLKTQADEKYPSNIPIIAMTAHALVDDHEKSLRAGMNDHITKPLDPGKIMEVLLNWVGPEERVENEIPSNRVKQTDVMNQASIPQNSGIDSESALKRLGGNSTLFIRLIKEFRQNNQEAAGRLRDALAVHNLEHAKEIAHGIKGAAANLGMNELSTVAAEFESLSEQQKLEACESLLDQFDLHLKKVIQAIVGLEQQMSDAVPQVEDNHTVVIDRRELSSLLKKLEASLDKDLRAANKYRGKLHAMLVNSEYDEMFWKLDREMSSYDSDGVREIIRAIEECTGCKGKA